MGEFSDLNDKVEREYEKAKEKAKEGLHKTGDAIEHVADK